MAIDPAKVEEARLFCLDLMSASSIPVKKFQKFLGKLFHATKCTTGARTFFNRLLDALATEKAGSVSLGPQAKADIHWFLCFLGHFNGVTLIKPSVAQHVIHVDSCLQGGGGLCSGLQFYKISYPQFLMDLRLSISSLECWNLLVAARIWLPTLSGTTVLLFCDNWATVAAINSGRATDPIIRGSLRELWWLAASHDVQLEVRHKPGADMIAADTLSRATTSSTAAAKFAQFAAEIRIIICVNLTFNSLGLSPKGSPLEALREAARLRRKEGYRPGSRKNLISCQTLFIQFALVYDVDLYAPRLDDFGAFAELLLISGRSPATVKNYLSAIKSLFQEWRAASVVKDLTSPAWTLTLRAISYSAGPQPDNRSAITLEDLTRLVAICNTDPSLVPLRVALVFGFLGYLRISNMTPPTAQSFDPTRHTSWADVRPCEQGLLLDLKWTKTLQTLDGRPCPLAHHWAGAGRVH